MSDAAANIVLTGPMPADAMQVVHVDGLDCRVAPFDWSFAREQAAGIDSHWRAALEQNPDLWNGRVLLCRHAVIASRGARRMLEAMYFEVDFKVFLAWRDFGNPDPNIRNCFAMAALRSRDGAFLLGKMSERTANSGRIYFPAGTPDPGDVKGEILDLAGSVQRELAEETGLAQTDVTEGAGFMIVATRAQIACMKELRTNADAAAVIARVRNFIAADAKAELSDLIAVFGLEGIDSAAMPGFVVAYLREKFGRAQPPG